MITSVSVESARADGVAELLQLSNEFTLAAIRRVDGGIQDPRIADVIADAAVYTGNHSQPITFGGAFNTQIFDITRTRADAANLEISLVP